MTDRPDRLVVVVGTGTDVGKTWVSAALLRRLRAAGHPVAARKPAQSYGADQDPRATDAAVLGRATGEASETVCPPARWYPVAMAPPMAADVLERPAVVLADLVAELAWPGQLSVGLVETAGGVRSPQAHDGDAADLARLLAPDVVLLVADAGLGAIGAVRLCADALAGPAGPCREVRPPRAGASPHPGATGRPDGFAKLAVVLNRFDPADDLHCRNRDWLRLRDGLSVLVMPGEEDGLCCSVLG